MYDEADVRLKDIGTDIPHRNRSLERRAETTAGHDSRRHTVSGDDFRTGSWNAGTLDNHSDSPAKRPGLNLPGNPFCAGKRPRNGTTRVDRPAETGLNRRCGLINIIAIKT